MAHADIAKGGMVWKEGIIKGRDDAGGLYKRKDDAGGHYIREGWCMRTLQKGRDGEEGGHYKREA